MRLASCLALVLSLLAPAMPARADLAAEFGRPPASARPWVYWFWLNGNITREGITADLEAMKRAGIGGVLIMEVDQGAPVGPVPFAGPKWRQLFAHVVHEARRLGLEVNMNDDAGWCGSGGPWITPDKAMQKVVWSETQVEGPARVTVTLPHPPTNNGYYRDIGVVAVPATGTYRIPDIAGKSALVRRDNPTASDWPAAPAGSAIPLNAIEVRPSRDPAAPDVAVTWDAPPGRWTLLRFGYTPTGAVNAPAPASGRGLECDKLSKAGAEAAFGGLMGKLVADSGPLTGKALVSTHIDSWEMGSQNWTAGFEAEFRRLRGYDPLPYLPVLTGRVVGSLEQSERFLWDFRRTVSDLLLDNYAGHMRDLAREHGIRLSIEAYGDAVFDDLAYAGRADEPMAEFWSYPGNFTSGSVYEMSSAARVYGKRILGAEAFTANDSERWLGHPATIKALGDWAFCRGINRFVVHRYAMQPWRDRKPGMSMGPWGLHYERTQTWWEQSGPWHQYVARCQHMLRQGLPVVDLLYLAPEGAPSSFTPPPARAIGGYQADACPADAAMTRLSVSDGRLALPDGMSYRALVLPSTPTMTPELLRRVKALADAGATIIGAPASKSPSLSGYPACDAVVAGLARELKASAGEPAKVLEGLGVPSDFRSDRLLDYIHRRDGQLDIYFVSNQGRQAVNASCEFRTTGKQPELWDAETGRIVRLAEYEDTGKVTRLPLRLDASGSAFVVFRPAARPFDAVVRLTRDGEALWPSAAGAPATVVIRRATWGPADEPARTKDVTAQVQRLVDSGQTSFVVADLVVEGDPAPYVVKRLRVQYEVEGHVLTASATDPELIALELPADLSPSVEVVRLADGRLSLQADRPGRYEATTRSGRTVAFTAPSLPAAVEVGGPWSLAFPPHRGAPASVTLTDLVSWSEHPESGVRYFSGTATYRTAFFVPDVTVAPGRRAYLDLGRVEAMARVKLNGRDLGILWRPPYRVDVTDMLRPGVNELEVQVTNLWPNRQIGDEQLPEDSARNPDGTLREWPAWLQQGKPSPAGRYTFTSWRLWRKDSPLQPSGLLGPVRIETEAVVAGR